MKKHYVFVYGTLRTHQNNHYLLEQAERIAMQCWTHGKLYDVGCGYPAVIAHNTSLVYGELYHVTDEELTKLDLLETYYGPGQDNEYERVEQTVYTDRGTYNAYIYLYTEDQAKGLTEITSGDWKCHKLLQRDTLYYFAYGSCMDNQRFIKHGVDKYFTNVTGRGLLLDYELGFTKPLHDGGRADIIEGTGYVEGKVYKVGEEAVRYLHKREGVHTKGYRPTFIDVEVNGKMLTDVLTYVVVDKQPDVAPPAHYWQEIIRGGNGCLSDKYINKLADDWKMKFGIDVKEWTP